MNRAGALVFSDIDYLNETACRMKFQAVNCGVRYLKAMLENWLGYVEKIVFRGGCFFAAASAEFDSRPGAVRDQIAEMTKAWMVGLQEEIAFAQSHKEIQVSIEPTQLAFELHAYVQEANWAFKLFNDKSAFLLARRAIADRIAAVSCGRGPNKPKR
jgi:hypothetical protein